MNGRDIWPRCGRQQRERFAAFRHRTPKAGETEPILVCLREFPLLLGRFGPGELEETRCRNQTSTDWKPPPFGTEIDDGRSGGPSRGEAPPQLRKFIRAIFEQQRLLRGVRMTLSEPPDHRSLISGPDVLAR